MCRQRTGLRQNCCHRCFHCHRLHCRYHPLVINTFLPVLVLLCVIYSSSLSGTISAPPIFPLYLPALSILTERAGDQHDAGQNGRCQCNAFHCVFNNMSLIPHFRFAPSFLLVLRFLFPFPLQRSPALRIPAHPARPFPAGRVSPGSRFRPECLPAG